MTVSAHERKLLNSLAAAVRTRQISQLQLAKAVGIDQSQVSRILAGQARRSSPNLKKLCNYASSLREMDDGDLASHVHTLEEAVKRIWDGSPAHAEALEAVLGAMEVVQATFHRGK